MVTQSKGSWSTQGETPWIGQVGVMPAGSTIWRKHRDGGLRELHGVIHGGGTIYTLALAGMRVIHVASHPRVGETGPLHSLVVPELPEGESNVSAS